MLTKKVWFATVATLGGGACIVIGMLNRFVPHLQDLSDPLGRPSALSLQVIHSASQFDSITSVLVPKHHDLGQRIQVLHTVADDLDGLVNKAGGLVPSAQAVNGDTTTVQGVATPLPPLINKVTGRAQQATPQVNALGNAVSSVTTQLNAVDVNMTAIATDLGALGPRAQEIVAILQEIEAESERIRPVAPLLPVLSTVTNITSSNGQPILGLLGPLT
ncbi:hypothetical protein NGB36_00365 [Streptomyces sp. RB6PN25]|uniref:Transmembrane protein n=1 Tax=Streptomyces humicola TaxID=2953240 RepID=A0ABT1PN60_9ACTN|nr:hypothetical protein [Streptomyces humicola]MCQ4079108.1 hypothetical protein [Streptomyces humicola]